MSKDTQLIEAAPLAGELTVSRIRLTVSSGPDSGKETTSSAAKLTLGTAPGNDLVLSDSTVSRFHAELLRAPTGLRIRDLGSTNGTRVDHVPVTEAWVADGSTLKLGNSSVRILQLAEQDVLPLHPEPHFGKLRGQSVAMRALFAQLARLSATDATSLIEGETGTGKELVAEALHEHSTRAGKPFVVVDCGSIPAELVESELFGHERGAFTGAAQERRGAFEAAQGGTLFLDEIGELPLAVQPKLLRALEKRQVKRVGADGYRQVDVRFIAATHRDLREAVNHGTFRQDLYFRLAVGVVTVPPLRAHLEDLPLLLRHLWEETFRALRIPDLPFIPPSPGTIEKLASRPWEGNVRELRNFVERSVALSGALDVSMAGERSRQEGPAAAATIRLDLPFREAKEAWLAHFERHYLRHRLEAAGGNVSQMAREAEVDRAHLISLLRKRSIH